MIKILLSNNPDNLKAALSAYSKTATVEAEYGSTVVEGSLVTLAHHGERSDNPPPCRGDNLGIDVDVIGVSHIDLDTLGGIARILNVLKLEDDGEFWEAAAAVDTLGVHKIKDILLGNEDAEAVEAQLNAYWAWSEEHTVHPDREGAVTDVTADVMNGLKFVTSLGKLSTDAPIIKNGQVWAKSKADLAEASFVDEKWGVVVRSAPEFTNHLYTDESACVVAYRGDFKSITISLANPVDGFDCCELMQELFGPDAGGQATIAGTPRDKEYVLMDAVKVAYVVRERLGEMVVGAGTMKGQ